MNMTFMCGMPEIREYIEFKEAVSDEDLISTLKSYIYFMFKAEKKHENSMLLEVTVSYSGKSCKIESFKEFVKLINLLSGTQPFSIMVSHMQFSASSEISGDYIINELGVFNEEKSLYERMIFFSETINLSYKSLGLTDCYEVFVNMIIDGIETDVSMDTDIINAGIKVWNNTDGISLSANFDYESYPDLLEDLHNLAKKYISEDEIVYSEEIWEGGDPCLIICGSIWSPDELGEIVEFISELNEIVEKSGVEVEFSVGESTFMALNDFAVAKLCVVDNEVLLIGAEF